MNFMKTMIMAHSNRALLNDKIGGRETWIYDYLGMVGSGLGIILLFHNRIINWIFFSFYEKNKKFFLTTIFCISKDILHSYFKNVILHSYLKNVKHMIVIY